MIIKYIRAIGNKFMFMMIIKYIRAIGNVSL